MQNSATLDTPKTSVLHDPLVPRANGPLPGTLPALIRYAAARSGSQPAIVDEDAVVSYADLLMQSQSVARSLIGLGVRAGDRVALWAPNMYEWIIAACGIHASGAVLLPLSTRMKGPEVIDILQRSRAGVLITIGNFLGQYTPSLLRRETPVTLRHTVVLSRGWSREQAKPGDLHWDDFLARGEAIDPGRVHEREAELGQHSAADLMFTSGTTGRPKGVMYAHGPTIRAFDDWSKVVDLRQGDRYLIINPFFHTFGYKAGWVAAFIRGATVYPEQTFDAQSVLERIQKDRINFLPGTTTLCLSMLAHPRLADYDLSSWRSTVTGGSMVPPALITRIREELKVANVTTAYGLTECGGCATVCEPTDSVETVARTCGHALPGTEIRCVDLQGMDVPLGQPGEVLLRGYHVMSGYFEDEVATRAAIDTGGWLHTGDVGVLDERGYLRITDRIKDMYIVGGFNCYPAEVERMLSDHPAIAQVAVVGVPDERMGEAGCACVILRHGFSLGLDELAQWARERMSNYKVPRHLLTFDSFPLNSSNKVIKRELLLLAQARLASA